MKEVFKYIPGYEGLYQISSLGNVKSLITKKILKPLTNTGGYAQVYLYKNGKRVFRVHRLVGQSFLGLDIKNRKMCVCHKDDNRLNNDVDNLFLGTHKDNVRDMYNKGRNVKYLLGKFGELHPTSRKVNQYDLRGNFIKTWGGLRDVERKLGINHGNISQVCNNKTNTAGGFIWKYMENE